MAKELKDYSKNWLVKKVESLQEELKNKEDELQFAYKQQQFFKDHAEKAGSEVAKIRHELIMLKEKHNLE